MVCAKCGASLKGDARFCKSCGSPVAGPVTCAKCGSALDHDARFCDQCGTSVAMPPTNNQDPPRRRLVVDPSGNGDHRTIGAAIRAAVVPGTLITVKPGTYRRALLIDRSVEIVGEGDRGQIVVEATDTDAVTVTADRPELRNLTVCAVGTKGNHGAVFVKRGNVVIVGCDLTSAIGAVVYITGNDSNPVIRDCEIRDGTDGGVVVWEHGQGTIEQCRIHGNADPGVRIRTGGNPIVRDCEIRDNKDHGVFVGNRGQGTFEQCRIQGNGHAGVRITTGGNPMVRDCDIRDNKQAGVYVHTQGKGTFTGNTLAGNAEGAWEISRTAGKVILEGNTPNM